MNKPTNIPALGGYAQLVKVIKAEIAAGRAIIQKTQAETYWKVGKYISNFLLHGEDRAQYGEKVYEKLSQDLKIGAKTLERAVRFSREFPIPTAQSKLRWTHYYELLAIPDQTTRDQLAQKTVHQNLSTRDLQKEVFKKGLRQRTIDITPPTVTLPLSRGKLFTYRIIESQKLAPPQGSVIVDCGFNVWREILLDRTFKVNPKAIYESVKGGEDYQLRLCEATAKELFTYKALVEKVIDGDTLWVNIDCGFNTWVRQKLRLRAIDAPEIATKQGRVAKRFVQKILSACEFIIVKTYQSDKYDRYLADIFYVPPSSTFKKVVQEKPADAPRPPKGEAGVTSEPWDPARVAAEGIYLNQELLNERLVVKWRG